ncbi:DUF1616 domain-containing protein [Halomarina litorea]|uniref:DUF1616 domain-containing protein n=1 Tax=Halomarina litorea TaxID=2961595 RepID=UPI0020C45A94|nr:DUF1616 domain-containing protein [Halomarina sp. BCD28]
MSGRRALTWALAAVLALSVVGVVALAAAPLEPSDPYTEFYVLGENGTAEYPTNLSVGEAGTVVVGVDNHEQESVTYEVVAVLGEREVDRRSVTVGDDETWRGTVEVTPREAGETELRFLLYRGGSDEPYRQLRLTLDVSDDAGDTGPENGSETRSLAPHY